MVDKTKETIDKDDSIETSEWLGNHDFNEIIETTNMEILDKYDLIPKDDFTKIRKVKIMTLPTTKQVDSKEFKGKMTTMTINDSGKLYNLRCNSIATQRSIIQMAIKESQKHLKRKLKDKKEIDMSLILGKLYNLSRKSFKAQGFNAQALVFSEIA